MKLPERDWSMRCADAAMHCASIADAMHAKGRSEPVTACSTSVEQGLLESERVILPAANSATPHLDAGFHRYH